MKQYIISIILLINFSLTCSIIAPGFNTFSIPHNYTHIQNSSTGSEKTKSSVFAFSFNQLQGEVSLTGYWNITIGLSASISYNPEFVFLSGNSGFLDSLILLQERLINLNIITGTGLTFSLFAPDDINKTEFTLQYSSNSVLKKFYISNSIEPIQINPYRTIQNSRAEDIAAGINWGNSVYRGNFDMKFDSTKINTERFTAQKKIHDTVITIEKYVRGTYYYLPDTNIQPGVEIMISSDKGTDFSSSNQQLSQFFEYLENGKDYEINFDSGTIVFFTDISNKAVIIHYYTSINGILHETGTTATGLQGILNSQNCNTTETPDLFLEHTGKMYLILNKPLYYSPFEEKNSYKITGSGTLTSDVRVIIKDYNGNSISWFTSSFDNLTGCVRISKNQTKGDTDNIYPFYAISSTLYTGSKPYVNNSQYILSVTFSSTAEKLILSSLPVSGTATVFLNSTKTDAISVNYSTGELIINTPLSSSDIIEVSYVTSETDDFFLTFSEKNSFRAGKFFFLNDSLYFKMPVKLWDTGYYNSLRHGEFLYNTGFIANFSPVFKEKEAKMVFTTDATLSVYIPEFKNISLIEDFEKNKTGYSLPLDHRNFYPSDIPSIYNSLSKYSWGKLFYRDMYKDGLSNGEYKSLFESPLQEKQPYENNNQIGPYSSSDGFTVDSTTGVWSRKQNSTSLIADISLEANEAVSMVLPINAHSDNLTAYSALTVLAESLDMTGSVSIYIDAGRVSERFQSNSSVFTEKLDEGIQYYLDSDGITLIKGQNDGFKTTNDFDANGILSPDDLNFISKIIPDNNTNEFISLPPGHRELYSMNIQSPWKLDGANGVRITIVNPSSSTVSGKIIFNQLRFVETGWYYDKSGNSVAEEIFPAEDSRLQNHIFSRENTERDKILHLNRNVERTLRIRISETTPTFYTGKILSPAINLSLFKKIGFYLLKVDENPLEMNLILINNDGEKKTLPVDYNNLPLNSWSEISFSGNELAFSSSQMIKNIQIEVLNTQLFKNTLFIDEFFIENIITAIGGGIKSQFEYTGDKVALKSGDFVIFSKPQISFISSLYSINFAETTMLPLQKSRFIQLSAISFNLMTFNFKFHETNTFDFASDDLQTTYEKTLIRILRNTTQKVPVFFNYSFDYQDVKNTGNYEYSKKTGVNIGYKNSYITISNGFDTLVYNSPENKTNTKVDFKIQTTNLPVTIVLQSFLNGIHYNTNSNEFFSLQHIGTAFSQDIPQFFGTMSQLFNNDFIEITAKPLNILTITMNYRLLNAMRFSGTNYNVSAVNTTGLVCNFITPQNDLTLVKIGFNRVINTNYEKKYTNVHWESFFNEKNTILINNYSILTLHPFPHTNFMDKAYLFDTVFSELSLSQYTGEKYFIPSFFKTEVKGNYYNKNIFISEYVTSFTLDGFYKTRYQGFNIDSGYSLNYQCKFKENDNEFGGGITNYFNISSEKIGLSQTGFNYTIIYTSKDELFSHSLTFSEMLMFFFYGINPVTEEFFGPEFYLDIDYSGIVYTPIQETTTQYIQKPVDLKLTPGYGYKFNKNISLIGHLRLAYSMQYSNNENLIKHDFLVAITITGKLSF